VAAAVVALASTLARGVLVALAAAVMEAQTQALCTDKQTRAAAVAGQDLEALATAATAS
jgi:hypothetical protein